MPDVLDRSFAVPDANALVNHPAVRPFVGGDISVELDLSDVLANQRNVFLMGEHGGFLMAWSSPGCYEVHTMIRPEGRGSWALDAARESFATMHREFGAQQIWTRISPDLRHVRAFAIAAGMTPCGIDTFDTGCGGTLYNLYEWRP